MSAGLTGAQMAFLREWLTRSIADLGTLPPSETRDRSIRILRQQLERYQTNIIPFQRTRT